MQQKTAKKNLYVDSRDLTEQNINREGSYFSFLLHFKLENKFRNKRELG